METQGNKLAYLAGGLGIILLLILFAWLVAGQKKVVSPVPEQGIKVIFTSPTPSPSPSPSPTVSPSPTLKPTPKPTLKATPTSSPAASPAASPTP